MSKSQTVMREMPSLELRASVKPSSVSEEKRTVDLVWSTGARVQRGFWDRYWEELSMDPGAIRMGRLQNGAPLLDSHRSRGTESVIGVVESARIENGKGIATVRFDEGPQGEDVFRKIRAGILRNISVGYQIHRLELVEEADGEIPVYRATDWEPMELSVVPINADADAQVRSGGTTNPCEFVFAHRGAEMADKTKTPNSGQAAPVAPTNETEQRSAEDIERERKTAEKRAAKLERERITGIQRAAAALGFDLSEAAELIDEGASLDEARAKLIDKRANEPTTGPRGPRVEPVMGGDERDKFLRAGTDHLIIASGSRSAVMKAAEKRGETVELDAGPFKGRTMLEVARMCLERAGVDTNGMSKMELAGRAFTERSGMAATGDFPVLLENVMHKTLQANYDITPDTWSLFCRRGSVSDFRPHHRYRKGSFSVLETVNEAGEIKNKAIPDGEKESISALTKANIIAITRQAIINDDLGAFTMHSAELGRAARRTIEVMVYAALAENSNLGPNLADGKSLFHADHNNLGAGVALTVAGLDADATILAAQMDPSNNDFLDLQPAVLLVARGLKGEAIVLNGAEFDPDAVAADTPNYHRKPNKVRGMFDTIVGTPRLSGTRRYVFADPDIAPVLEVVFLDGMDSPYIEIQNGWRIDGTQIKVRLDVGVGGVDFRGAVTDAGQ